MAEQKKSKRRRGKVLEDAILRAALDELSETGYENLTMENIAVRARTNKAVLYRRWPNKSKLVVAALLKYVPSIPHEVPNEGNLRNDVLTYLLGLVKPIQKLGSKTIRGLITDQFGSALISSTPQILRPRPEDKLTGDILKILKNAELRGEIKIENLSMRIISLPVDLLRYELITRLEPISDEAIAEIIDEIFLPLVHAQQD